MIKNKKFLMIVFCFMSLHVVQISWAMDGGEQDSSVFTAVEKSTDDQLIPEQLAEEKQHDRVLNFRNMSLKDKWNNLELGRNGKTEPKTTSVSLSEAIRAVFGKPKADDAAVVKAKYQANALANPGSGPDWYDMADDADIKSYKDQRANFDARVQATRVERIATAKNDITELLSKLNDGNKTDLKLNKARLVHTLTSSFPKEILVSFDQRAAQNTKSAQAVKAAVETLTQPYNNILADKGDVATIEFLNSMRVSPTPDELIIKYLQDTNKRTEILTLLNDSNLSQADFEAIMNAVRVKINEAEKYLVDQPQSEINQLLQQGDVKKAETLRIKLVKPVMVNIRLLISDGQIDAALKAFKDAFPTKTVESAQGPYMRSLITADTKFYDEVGVGTKILTYPSADWSLIAHISSDALESSDAYVKYLLKTHQTTDLYRYLQDPRISKDGLQQIMFKTISELKLAQERLQLQNPQAFAKSQVTARNP